MPTIQFSTTVRRADDFTNVTVTAHVTLCCPATMEDPQTYDEAEN